MLAAVARRHRLLTTPQGPQQLLSIPGILYDFHAQQQPIPNTRHASLTSAIHNGIRRGSKRRSTNPRNSSRTNAGEQDSSSRYRKDGPSSKTPRSRDRQPFNRDEPAREGGMDQLRAFARSGAPRGKRPQSGSSWSGRGRQGGSGRQDETRGKGVRDRENRSSHVRSQGRRSDYPKRSFDRSERTQERELRDGDGRSSYRESQGPRSSYQKRPYARSEVASSQGREHEASRSTYPRREPQTRGNDYQRRAPHRSEMRPDKEPEEETRPSKYRREPHTHRNGDQRRASPRSETSPKDSQDSQSLSRHIGPIPIPYTTAESQFLYGRSVVLAALRSRRRRIYQLFVVPEEERGKTDSDDYMVVQLAKSGGVQLVRADRDLLSKMSKGRPHNGYILEASPLPQPGISFLPLVTGQGSGSFHAFLDQKSWDLVRQIPSVLTPSASTEDSRYPFVLWLDEIVDPENFGSIMRSAAFFGVDALVTSNSSSAPLSAVAIKASTGASEHLPLFKVSNKTEFMRQSSANSWKFYAAVAPNAYRGSSEWAPSPSESPSRRYLDLSHLDSPLNRHPVVLMLGSEGHGLSPALVRKAHHEVGIRGGANRPKSLDSLNAGVAAGILCQAFTGGGSAATQQQQPPDPKENIKEPDSEEEVTEEKPDSEEATEEKLF